MPIMYCPCCENRGLDAYTKWNSRISNGSSEMLCVANDEHWHHTFMLNGAYCFCNRSERNDGCWCSFAYVDDDNSWCDCGTSRRYRIQYILLKNALYTDVKNGINPEIWAPTFPRRVGKVMEKYKKKTAKVLSNEQLPAVIIGIICSYQWEQVCEF